MLVEREDRGSWRRRKRRGSSWRRRGRRGGGEGRGGGGRREQPIASHGTDSLRCQGNARQQLPTLGDVFKSQEREGEKVILPFRCPSDPSVSERGPKPQSRKPFHYRGTLMKKAFAEVCVAKKKVSGRLQ